MEAIGVAQKKGFETVFELAHNKTLQCVQVGAIRDGEIIRMSNTACVGDKVTSKGDYLRLFEANERMKAELAELEHATWGFYKVFAEVAMGVVLVAVGVWVSIFLRDWRQRQQYQSVSKEEW